MSSLAPNYEPPDATANVGACTSKLRHTDDAIYIAGWQNDSGYEYFIKVYRQHWPTLLQALDGQTGDDVHALFAARFQEIAEAGELSWLRSRHIPREFFSPS